MHRPSKPMGMYKKYNYKILMANQEVLPITRFTDSPQSSITSGEVTGRDGTPSTSSETARFVQSRSSSQISGRQSQPQHLSYSQSQHQLSGYPTGRPPSTSSSSSARHQVNSPHNQQQQFTTRQWHGEDPSNHTAAQPASTTPLPLSISHQPSPLAVHGGFDHAFATRTPFGASLTSSPYPFYTANNSGITTSIDPLTRGVHPEGVPIGGHRVTSLDRHVYEEVGPPDVPMSPRGTVSGRSTIPMVPSTYNRPDFQQRRAASATPTTGVRGARRACGCAPVPQSGPPPSVSSHPLSSAQSQPCIVHPSYNPELGFGGHAILEAGHSHDLNQRCTPTDGSMPQHCLAGRSMSQSALFSHNYGGSCAPRVPPLAGSTTHLGQPNSGGYAAGSLAGLSYGMNHGGHACCNGFSTIGHGHETAARAAGNGATSTCGFHGNSNNNTPVESDRQPRRSTWMSAMAQAICWPCRRLFGGEEDKSHPGPAHSLDTLSAEVDRTSDQSSGKDTSWPTSRKFVLIAVLFLAILAISVAVGIGAAYGGGTKSQGDQKVDPHVSSTTTTVLRGRTRIIGGQFANYTSAELRDTAADKYKWLYYEFYSKVDRGLRSSSAAIVRTLYNRSQVYFSSSNTSPTKRSVILQGLTAVILVELAMPLTSEDSSRIEADFTNAFALISDDPAFQSQFILDKSEISFKADFEAISTPISWGPSVTAPPTSPPPPTSPTPVPSTCVSIQESTCAAYLPEGNGTAAFPNLLGKSKDDSRLLLNLLSGKANCSSRDHYFRFLCTMLTPPCHGGRPVPPCKSFCEEMVRNDCSVFLRSIGNIDCNKFVESDDPNVCIPSIACQPGQIACDGICQKSLNMCDLHADCSDGRDESPELCDNWQCSPQQFRCSDGKCTQGLWVCDGTAECPDGSDEDIQGACAPHGTCSGGSFQCGFGGQGGQNGTASCVKFKFVCDGRPDCAADDSDESEAACAEKQRRGFPTFSTNLDSKA